MLFNLSQTYGEDKYKLDLGIYITSEQVEEIKQRLPRLEEDRIFFHSTTEEIGIRRVSQSKIYQKEMDQLNITTHKNQAYGAGLYFAEEFESSRAFNSFSTALKIKKGTYIYNRKIIASIIKRDLKEKQITKLGEIIPFIRNISESEGWWITNDPQVIANIEYGGFYGAHPDFIHHKTENLNIVHNAFKKIGELNDHGKYFENLYHLTYYLDGFSLIKTIHSPEELFNNQDFKKFKKLRQFLLDNITQKSYNSPWGIESENKAQWVTNIMNNDFNKIFHELSGKDLEFRSENKNSNNKLIVSLEQLNTLMDNPYLEVNYKSTTDKDKFLVSYFHPDVYHYKKLKNKISLTLFKKLETISNDDLVNNKLLRQNLNQQLLKELFNDFLSQLYDNKLEPASFLRTFKSIRPFQNLNNKSARLFLEKELLSRGQSLPPNLFDNLAPLISNQTLKDSKHAYIDLYHSFITTFISKTYSFPSPYNYEQKQWSEFGNIVKTEQVKLRTSAHNCLRAVTQLL